MATWSPSDDDIRRVFDEQNPWHQLGEVPGSLAPPIERPLATSLWKAMRRTKPRRYQLILGPRRVGKSTVLYQTVRHLIDSGIAPTHIWWLRLDHPLLLETSLGDLVRTIIATQGATETKPVYLMLDELVYAKNWDGWLKTFFDEQWPVRIAATSSATAALRDRRHESGIGRWSEQHLAPYQFTEFLNLVDPEQELVVNRDIHVADSLGETLRSLPPSFTLPASANALRNLFMLVGGFPELLTSIPAAELRDLDNELVRSQQTLRSDAVERAIYKDIPQTFKIENPMLLERLLYILAGQIGGTLSPSNISNDLGMSQPTVDRYLNYLEQAFLVFTLPNYSGSEATIQRRGRKLYFVDGAVRNAALQRGIAPLSDDVELGHLMENLVAASLRSLAAQAGNRLFHWRERKVEVDLILDHPTHPVAFEVASSTTHHRRGLEALIERHPRFHGRSFLVAPQAAVVAAETSPSGIGSLPTNALLLASGAQASSASLL